MDLYDRRHAKKLRMHTRSNYPDRLLDRIHLSKEGSEPMRRGVVMLKRWHDQWVIDFGGAEELLESEC